MDATNITRLAEHIRKEVEREVNDRLPRKVGITAVNHFRQNFRDEGFRDGGLKPWKKTLRQQGGGTDAKYGALTSRRNHLMNSLQYRAAPGQVTIENPVPYAAIHNEGGTLNTHPRVTAKMRKFAWAMAYRTAGVRGKGKLPKDLPYEAKKWRALALTKKSTLNITAHIPQRQFMGESKELSEKVNKMVMESIEKIKNGVSSLSDN